ERGVFDLLEQLYSPGRQSQFTVPAHPLLHSSGKVCGSKDSRNCTGDNLFRKAWCTRFVLYQRRYLKSSALKPLRSKKRRCLCQFKNSSWMVRLKRSICEFILGQRG